MSSAKQKAQIEKLKEELAMMDQNFVMTMNKVAEARTKEDWTIIDELFKAYGIQLKEVKPKSRIIT
jgi:hypothetical protein